jgi:hypothetical protein
MGFQGVFIGKTLMEKTSTDFTQSLIKKSSQQFGL